MDREPSQTDEIQRLIRLGGSARGLLGAEAARMKRSLDVPARVRSSLKQHPTGWLVAALGSGLMVSALLRRRSSSPSGKKHRSLPIAALGLVLTAFRPFLKMWLTDQVKNYLIAHLRGQNVVANRPARVSNPL